ncbi:uncharacterized protein LOC128866823 [Anastrepha ludens]|uniref:uncharacterized protein LOC128866823 n=1 Tax=Anastrepha ludens TaxID=28586 RepID=UPI0023B0E0C6|nr:uncharacterized protein LOC128866823 [Anastrepha ludens]
MSLNLLGSMSPSKLHMAPDTSTSSDNATAISSLPRNIHIPYILNGELFEIQTQDGENVTVKCCNCPPDRVYRGSVRSTGNFHMHIKRRHPDLMGKIYDMKVNALVDRRDRFLRNRKSTRRRSNNATGNRAPASRIGQQPPSELFKIKAAFQRHQLQQQQNRNQQGDPNQKHPKTEQSSDILQKWNALDPFLVTPGHSLERAHNNTLMDAYIEKPLNFSLKQNANESTVANINYAERAQELGIKEAKTPVNFNENDIPMEMVANEQITGYELLSLHSKNNYQAENCNSANERFREELSPQADEHVALYPINSDQSFFGRATTLSAITPCPSNVNSYDGSQGANSSRPYDLNCKNLDVIKNELLLGEIQPIDLSIAPSSSTLSSSSGFGSAVNATQTSRESDGNIKYDELIVQVVHALQHLQRELQSHNQTNSKWLSLEIAKFKFLHPEFEF